MRRRWRLVIVVMLGLALWQRAGIARLVQNELFMFFDARGWLSLSAYDQDVLDSPFSADSYIRRGRALHRMSEYRRAVADFTAALQIEPGSSEALAGRAASYSTSPKCRPDALQDCDAALKSKHDDPELFLLGAVLLHDESQFDELEQVLATLKPSDGIGRPVSTKELATIEARCTAALQLKPDMVKAMNLRGICYRLAGRLNEAINEHTRAISFAPSEENSYYNRAFAFLLRDGEGDWIRADSDFDMILQKDNPYDYDSYTKKRIQRVYMVARLYRAARLGPQEDFERIRTGFEAELKNSKISFDQVFSAFRQQYGGRK